MALYIPHSIFHLARLLYVRPETFGPYYIYEHIQADVYWLLSDKSLVFLWQLHEVYCRICKKKNILAVDQAEFLSLCHLVETRGILKVQGRKEARLSRVSVIHVKLFYIQSIILKDLMNEFGKLILKCSL